MSTPAIEFFKSILEQTPVGPIDKDSVLGKTIISALAAAWMDFSGSSAENTYAYKVADRAEQLKWDPPNFVFVIERHGQTALGSIWGGLHTWTVNLTENKADYFLSGKRQVNPKAKSITKKDMQIMAESIADKIEADIPDPCITWLKTKPVATVTLNIVFPSSAHRKRTVQGLRTRFSSVLFTEMKNRGWEYVSIGSRLGFKR